MTLEQAKESTATKPGETAAKSGDTSAQPTQPAPEPGAARARTGTQAPQKAPNTWSELTDNWWYYALVLVAIILIYFIYRVLLRKPEGGKP